MVPKNDVVLVHQKKYYNECKSLANAKTYDAEKVPLCKGLLISGNDKDFDNLKCMDKINEPDCSKIPDNLVAGLTVCNANVENKHYRDAMVWVCHYLSGVDDAFDENLYNKYDCDVIVSTISKSGASELKSKQGVSGCELINPDKAIPMNDAILVHQRKYYNNCKFLKGIGRDDRDALCKGLLISGNDKDFDTLKCMDKINEPDCSKIPDNLVAGLTVCNANVENNYYHDAMVWICHYLSRIDDVSYDKYDCDVLLTPISS